jgi:hypothetical protein
MRQDITQQGSRLPSLLLASAGIALAIPLVHDAIDQRIFTPESIFDCRATALLAVIGMGGAGVLLWDFFISRRAR